MSLEAVYQVVERAVSDPGFLDLCAKDPDGALASYDLTPEEKKAIVSGKAHTLGGLAVDERVSKSFRLRG
jgi:hypothetical protein